MLNGLRSQPRFAVPQAVLLVSLCFYAAAHGTSTLYPVLSRSFTRRAFAPRLGCPWRSSLVLRPRLPLAWQAMRVPRVWRAFASNSVVSAFALSLPCPRLPLAGLRATMVLSKYVPLGGGAFKALAACAAVRNRVGNDGFSICKKGDWRWWDCAGVLVRCAGGMRVERRCVTNTC